jgi:hypothetical protein
MILASTALHASTSDGTEGMEWHSEGSVLYIVLQDREEIDLRIDREVFDVQVCAITIPVICPLTYIF